jgi:hypothetical protein
LAAGEGSEAACHFFMTFHQIEQPLQFGCGPDFLEFSESCLVGVHRIELWTR